MAIRKINALQKTYGSMLAIILALAWPTMLEQTLHTLVQYIDAAMVGRLGPQATAAVGATSTVSWLVNSTISGLGIGFLAYISRELGAGRRESASHAAAQAVLMVLISGSAFTLLALPLAQYVPVWMQADSEIQDMAGRYFFILYTPMLPRAASMVFGTVLRAAGDTRTPMRIGVGVNGVNVVLNYLLIYPSRLVTLLGVSFIMPGAGLGVEGAAIASAAAFAVGGVSMTIALYRHRLVSPRGLRLRADWTVLKPCLRVALPSTLQRFATSLGYVAFAAMINALGTVALAAHSIANTVESAFYIPGYGMQAAAATLAGNALGARDEKRMHMLTRTLVAAEALLMIGSGALLWFFADPMMRLFTGDAAVIALGAVVLRMVALSEPFYGVSIVLEGVMQGVGSTVKPFIYSLTGMWGVRILGTLIATHFLGQGLVAAWGCMIAHNLMVFVLLTACWARGRWNPLNKRPEVMRSGA